MHEEANHQSQEDVGCASSNTQVNSILEMAQPILNSIVTSQGDFSNRTTETRTKEWPTPSDINNINHACDLLIRRSTGYPRDEPFQYLWLVICVLYAVVVAFLLIKGWKKEVKGWKKTGKFR